jgi:hypothetical protein
LFSHFIDLFQVFLLLNSIAAGYTSCSLFKIISLSPGLNIVRRHDLSEGITTVSYRTHCHEPGLLLLIHVKPFFERARSLLTSGRSLSWTGSLHELLLHLSVSAVKKVRDDNLVLLSLMLRASERHYGLMFPLLLPL